MISELAGCRIGRVVFGFPVLAAAVVATGCQSTQDKSAEIAASLPDIKQEKPLTIDRASPDIKVLDSKIVSSQGESAVIVTLQNKSDKALLDAPILIDVLDAGGQSVFRNDTPGIEPALASIPLIKPGEKLDWVHNQVLAAGEPDSVRVKVGATGETFKGPLPDIEVRDAKLETDAVSGVNAAGVALNRTKQVQERLLIYGIARRGGKVVAAGRAAIENMKPGKSRTYHIFLIGDPKGAEISVDSFPTLARP